MRVLASTGWVGVLCALLASGVMPAAEAKPRLDAVEFCANLPGVPVFLTHAPGDSTRLFIVEQGGVIRTASRAGAVNPTPFLDISAEVLHERECGLLGLAFHPDYATNRRFYVYFSSITDRFGADDTIVAEFTRNAANPAIADNASGRVILRIPNSLSNHNSGWMAFGPDRHLYIACGERGESANAQVVTNNLLGKILRIDVDGADNLVGTGDDDAFPNDANKNYAIPAANPFVGCAGDDEILLWGLRNPWRNSFDRANGQLWLADVGEGTPGEITIVNVANDAGRNLGWPCLEGGVGNPNGCASAPAGCTTRPLYNPIIGETEAGCALTGGYVYRGCAIPSLRGFYIYSDFCSGYVRALRNAPQGPVDSWMGLEFVGTISSFGEDQDGELYMCDLSGRRILKIVPENSCALGCSAYCPADLDGGQMNGQPDCAVTIDDLIYFLNAFEDGSDPADVDDGNMQGYFDGAVTIDDLVYFLVSFENGC